VSVTFGRFAGACGVFVAVLLRLIDLVTARFALCVPASTDLAQLLNACFVL
jgi:hypothetical protein